MLCFHTNTHNTTQYTDTEEIYENMVGDISRSFNIPYRYDVRMRILGTTETMTAKIAVNELKLPITTDQFKRVFTELGRQRLGNAPLLQGLSLRSSPTKPLHISPPTQSTQPFFFLSKHA